MELKNINVLIFDLGGVIVDLDIAATSREFAFMADKPVAEVEKLAGGQTFFADYELGKIDDNAFRTQIREMLKIFNSDEEIDAAWNAMIKSIKPERLALIGKINRQYQCFVMSNTNDIHLRYMMPIGDRASPSGSFQGLFKQMYFSQKLGAAKPDPAAWQSILDKHQLDPATTLFIDDRLDNIEGAAKLGIQGYHNQEVDDWMSLFRHQSSR